MHLWCSLSRYSLNYFLFPLLLIICLEEADCWMRICPSQYSKVSKSLSTSLQAFSCHLKHSKTVAFPNLQKMENSSIIIDLPFPHIGGEAIQRLKNDIVLAKAIDGKYLENRSSSKLRKKCNRDKVSQVLPLRENFM